MTATINAHNKKTTITGLILSGGQGSRMGGVDKGWVTYQGKPMIEWAVAGLQPQVDKLMISANREVARYQSLGFPTVSDHHHELGEFAGPLAGIYAGAVASSSADWMITIPVDSPYLPEDYVAQMVRAQQHKNADVIVATDGEYPQPVFLLLRPTLAPTIAKQLSAGNGKIMAWVRSQDFKWCQFDHNRMFENKNKPDDLLI